MRAFTYDVESIDLTADEMRAFAMTAQAEGYPDLQKLIAVWLAQVGKAQPVAVAEYAGRQVQRMWRAESKM